MNNNILIDINKIEFSYQREKSTFLLKVSNLTIEKNKITTIVGRSGIGKSTLLDIVGLIKKPSDFKRIKIKYYFDDVFDVEELWRNHELIQKVKREKIGYIFQDPFFLGDISIDRNMNLYSLLKDVEYNKRGETFRGSSVYFDLFEEQEKKELAKGNKSNSPVLSSTISGGQRQRLSVLRAALPGTELIIADEPTGNLDPVSSMKVFEFLKNWINIFSKSTIVMVTHDIDSALKYSDVLCVIDSTNEIKPNNIFQRVNGTRIWHSNNAKEQQLLLDKESVIRIYKS